jgi:hypothetical protein
MKYLLYAFTCYLIACDSPRNHRINENPGVQKTEISPLELKVVGRTLKAEWVEGPFGSIEKSSVLLVYMLNAQKRLESLPEGLELQFYATMPSMGHPLSHAGYFQRIADGVYINKDVIFNMAGDWLMEISVIDEQGNTKDVLQWLLFF